MSNPLDQAIKNADVVIINPTYYAIGIQYNESIHNAPIVVAKGIDDKAVYIQKIAERSGIYIHQNAPMAVSLYNSVDNIGDPIPEDLYQAVADVLVCVFNMRDKERVQMLKIYTGILFLPSRMVYLLTKTFTSRNEDDISIDMRDYFVLFGDYKKLIVATAEYQGEDAAFNAIDGILKSVNVNSGAIVHFQMSSEYPFMELSNAMNFFGTIPMDHELIYGTTTDESLPLDFIRITLITASTKKSAIKANKNVY